MKRGIEALSFFLIAILVIGLVYAGNETNNTSGNKTSGNTTTSGNGTSTSVSAGTGGSTTSEETTVADVDSTTEKEVKVMVMNKHGARIRILQLQRAINKMILYAQAIVDVIKEKGEDTSVLENIIEEMKLVLNDSKSLDPNSDSAVQDFVNVKEDAIKLRKEFHDNAKPLLNASDKKALKEKFKEIDRSQLKSLTQEIRKERCLLNAQRIRKLGQLAEVDVSNYATKVEKCELKPVEALKILRRRYKALKPAKRREIAQRIRQNLRKEDVVKARRLIKAREARLKLASQRAQRRAQWLKARGFEIPAKRLEERSKLFKVRYQKIKSIETYLKKHT